MVIDRRPGSAASILAEERSKRLGGFGGHRVGIDRSDLVENLEQVVGREGRLAGGELVEEHSQREDVAGLGGRLAADLLGRQVAWRAEQSRRRSRRGPARPSRRCGPAARAGAARQAEIEDLDQPVGGDHHIFGLQVAVHDSLGMGGRHSRGDLAGDRQQRRSNAGRPVRAILASDSPAIYSMLMIGTPAESSTA